MKKKKNENKNNQGHVFVLALNLGVRFPFLLCQQILEICDDDKADLLCLNNERRARSFLRSRLDDKCLATNRDFCGRGWADKRRVACIQG